LVLGGDDGKECTYAGGYLTRQAVFSCLTYVPAGNAGVCTACSLSCHDGHEVSQPIPPLFQCILSRIRFGFFLRVPCMFWKLCTGQGIEL
jgi:E3 ubiquitin-protein ligase UBR7